MQEHASLVPPLPVDRRVGCPFDPPPGLNDMKLSGPIVRAVHQDGYVGWLITDHSLAREMLLDSRFSARSDLRRSAVGDKSGEAMSPPLPGQFISMDKPEHSRYRKLLAKYFTVNRLDRMTADIERIVDAQLEVLAADGSPADLVRAFAMPVPSLVMGDLIGVPAAHRQAVQQINTDFAMAEDIADRNRQLGRLWAYLSQLIEYRRHQPGPGLISSLIAEHPDLTDGELLQLTLGLILGGHETTANMISLGVFALLRHPDQLDRMMSDPASDGAAVTELLRYLTVTHLGLPYRAALEDVELGGVLIGKGETVTIALPATNRDESVFAAPDTLELGRSDARHHLAFGYGAHRCLGQYLAELELRIVYRRIFERLPGLRLAVEDVPMRGNATIYGPKALMVTWDARGRG